MEIKEIKSTISKSLLDSENLAVDWTKRKVWKAFDSIFIEKWKKKLFFAGKSRVSFCDLGAEFIDCWLEYMRLFYGLQRR